MAKNEPDRFPGVTSPNTTQVPDQYLDELLPVLTGGELKVLLYITRRTFGFKKPSDTISLSQMLHGIRTRDGRQLDRGCGLSKKTLLAALRSLKRQNIILSDRRRSAERGDEPTCYRLNIIQPAAPASPPEPVGEKVPQGGGAETPPGPWGRKSTTQQTGEQPTARHQTASSNDTSSKRENRSRAAGSGQASARSTISSAPSPGETAGLDHSAAYRTIVETLLADFSREFGDAEHTRANTTQTLRLFRARGLTEAQVASRLYEARSITRDEINRRRLAGAATPVRKAMPYYFAVLRDLLGERPATDRGTAADGTRRAA